MKTRSITAALAAAALVPTLLAGCGTSDPQATTDRTPPPTASGECADDTTTTSTGPVEVTDVLGRTVSLDAPAERVAVLEWQQIEDVLTLCRTPVAVADAEGYRTWVTAEELPDGVADVGGRGEPNLDALFAANPDLVIVEATTADDPIITQLAEYDVPVLATRGADTADPVQNMLDTFTLIAEALGRTERADVVVEQFQAGLDQAKQDVAAAGPSTTEFVYFDGWIQGGNVALRPFGQGSLVGELGEAIGLTNAWTGEVDPAYGLGQTDVEGISTVGDATFFHTGTTDPASDVIAELQKNEIWSSLPAVTQGRAHSFPPGIWTFGGPRSSQQVLDAYVDLLTN
ncbi:MULTISPECIES: iron-siderophore ABC transporter substrate-binding protein [unclassified Solwaraspora]|uniref:iron-siderophore ABC transporter substrate-binding protein n=1 Tax=unclassified Solwaraspora TaxID=2627926 RepID=UPI00259B47E0|nr:iron-siderophore ABC transporter substrate-binding protein [Solwaraspora sp. WMMA2056]WJK38603.1 iron-siderophore ABC transporter substrate-binding protein [Solwaraspora sp. WMMA2056]